MDGRKDLIDRLRGTAEIDVLVIGGGINGVGVYRDLAAQGVAALLVDAGDFASGTSAAPSRLIHGGLRYLETGEVALVRESVEERNLLLLNAPHYIRPIPTWVPLLSWTGGMAKAVARFFRLTRTPSAKGAFAVKAGLMLYDLFGERHRTMPKHRLLSRRAARAEVPALAPSVRAVAEYFDARITHPERLTMELVGDAERDCPASLAIPYLAADGLAGGRVVLRDTLDGASFTIAPKLVINTSGAWVDRVHGVLGIDQRLIGGTKGSHIVVRHPGLAAELGERMLYFETADNRACLIYRLGDDRLLLGTTDIRTEDPGDMVCSDAEIDYLFAVLRKVVPHVALGRGDIVFSFAGVRPLPLTGNVVAGAISRDHTLRTYEPAPGRPFPMLSLVGGKWTTYRACAAQIVDAALPRLGRSRRADLTRTPIGGGSGFPTTAAEQAAYGAELARRSGLGPDRAACLTLRYGSLAAEIAAAEAAAGGGCLTQLPDYSAAEISYICRNERVTRLADVILRRTLIAFEGGTGEAAVRELAGVVGAALGWSEATTAREIEACLALLRDRHRVGAFGTMRPAAARAAE